MIVLDPAKVVAIMLDTNGWSDIEPGSLTIDNLQLYPPGGEPPEAEDYGFSCISYDGHPIHGRISALLAVQEAAPG